MIKYKYIFLYRYKYKYEWPHIVEGRVVYSDESHTGELSHAHKASSQEGSELRTMRIVTKAISLV